MSSSSTAISDALLSMDNEDAELGAHPLESYLDALYEKRGSTRERALSGLVDAFSSHFQVRFAENNYITMQHLLINSIKRGSTKEASLACHALGLLAITLGSGCNAHEILKESFPHLSQFLKSGSDSVKRTSIVHSLAIVTFVGGSDCEETMRSLDMIWQMIHPKSGSNVAVNSKLSTAALAAALSSWSFLLASTCEWKVNSKTWQESVSFLSNLLEKGDRSVRIAAAEAIALIFEIGSIEKTSEELNMSVHTEENEGNKFRSLRGKILSQARKLSAEAGGRGSGKKDLNNQRNLFRDVLAFLENDECPETLVKLQGATLRISTWSQSIQLNFLKQFLGSGFLKQMQENKLLHEIFDFTPKKRNPSGYSVHLSGNEKMMSRWQNAATSKARAQMLNKRRMISEERNRGQYGVSEGNEEL